MERREAFEDYKQDLKKQEVAREEERAAKLKSDFRIMLQRHPEVQRYSRWKTIRPIIEQDAVFRSTDNEEERKKLFGEYIQELKQAWQEKRFRDHEEALNELGDIMKEINIEPSTKWDGAQTLLDSNDTFRDEKFTTLTKSEVLDKFSNHMRQVWDVANNERQQKKHLQARQARKNRDGFVDLLQTLHHQDFLHATTSWQTILPNLSSSTQYSAILSNCKTGDLHLDGSTPLDLYFDFVDDLEKDIRDLVHHTESLIKDLHLSPTPTLSFNDFKSQIVAVDNTLSQLSPGKLAAVHTRLITFLISAAEESARSEERKEKKRLIDALRSRIKRLEPAVSADDTWEVIRPRIERLEEYAALPNEDDRRAAFEKFVSRNLGIEEDSRRSTGRGGRKDRDRRDGGRRSRSPSGSVMGNGQVDPYAEDRRRAIEQRERLYRHSGGNGDGGLSPPRDREKEREREKYRDDNRHERRDRERDRDRRRGDDYHSGSRRVSLDDPLLSAISSSSRRRGEDRFDRPSRKERDAGDMYMSRADPYSRGDGGLDYGDEVVETTKSEIVSGSTGNAKRGATDQGRGEEGSKRVKLNGHVEKVSKKTEKGTDGEDAAVHSGSEEGEIEES